MIVIGKRPKKVAKSETDISSIIGSEMDDPMDMGSVTVENNRIYFYSDIDRNSVLQLNKAIYSTSLSMLNKALEFNAEPAKIYLHINSDGGEVEQGLIASDYIKSCKVPVWTVIDGICASAGTYLSIVGQRRFMHENSFMLLHQLSGQLWGTFANLQDEMDNCTMLMQVMKTLYKKHTKIPMKILEEILKKDLLLTSKECLKYNLVDEII